MGSVWLSESQVRQGFNRAKYEENYLRIFSGKEKENSTPDKKTSPRVIIISSPRECPYNDDFCDMPGRMGIDLHPCRSSNDDFPDNCPLKPEETQCQDHSSAT
jgi:hypothetical protein